MKQVYIHVNIMLIASLFTSYQILNAHELRTLKGTLVEHIHREDTGWCGWYWDPIYGWEWDCFTAEWWTQYSDWYYEGLYEERLARANRAYNCHAYAWTGARQSKSSSWGWINTPNDNTYWNDGSYIETTANQASYANYGDYYDHSVVLTGNTIGGEYEVTSKWGNFPVYRHKIWSDPYGEAGAGPEDTKYYKAATWSGQHNVNYDLRIPIGTKFIINPGATLKFYQGKKLQVEGAIIAEGTSGSRITFTRSGSSGTWYGIWHYNGSSGTIDHATIEHATKGVYANLAYNVTVKNSTIRHFSEQGIYALRTRLKAENNTILIPGGSSHGIYFSFPPSNGTNTIKNNDIYSQSYHNGIGIEVKDVNTDEMVEVSGNEIQRCQTGIKAYDLEETPYPEFFNNDIHRNTYGIRIGEDAEPEIHDNIIWYNTIGIYLDEWQPSQIKWNRFGKGGYPNDEGIRINNYALSSGNSFLNNQWNNFHDGDEEYDIRNFDSSLLKAENNYWEYRYNTGSIDASPEKSTENPDAGPRGGLGKKAAGPIDDQHSVAVLPDRFELMQNYPNPFNPTTTISYNLPKDSHVMLTIFDITGREITTLVGGNEVAGHKSVVWHGTYSNGNPVSSGLYFYRVKAYSLEDDSEYHQTRKTVLLR